MVQAIDQAAVNTIRVLAGDMTHLRGSGHPGAPMGCAPMAHTLFSRFLNVDPQDPDYIARDRFVLSNGHASALHYIMLHLMGFDMTVQDLKDFRRLGSKTPGHPEAFHTPGVEVTTGPLGQGISTAVGLAAAEAHLAAKYNRPGYDIFNNYTYVIVGDGCLQEGVTLEAVSLAGHWKLGKLIVLYDSNKMTDDGDTAYAFTEDVAKRLEACGWHTTEVKDGNNDIEGIAKAIEEARAMHDKPSLIKINTTIGFGSLMENDRKVHGHPLTADDVVQLKEKLGFDVKDTYVVPNEVRHLYAARAQHGKEHHASWKRLFEEYSKTYNEEAAEIIRRFKQELPDGWENALPHFNANDPPTATRKSSGAVLNALASVIPDFTSGCADITNSTLNKWKDAGDFQHPSTGLGDYTGQYFRYGVREHAMCAILNGMARYGGIIPIGATFLNFLSYGYPAVRLAALTGYRIIYVMTHDSIGLGEDGPTHQPIELVALLRSMPNLLTFRPADGNEVAGAWMAALKQENRHHHHYRPCVLCLSRQDVPQLVGSSAKDVSKGAYIIQESPSMPPKVILVATGSEVTIAMETANRLQQEKEISARVVSMPCTELYDEQPDEYKKTLFLPGVPVISIEALGTRGWELYADAYVGMTSYGLSGPMDDLYKYFGITPEAVINKACQTITRFEKEHCVPTQLGA
ncbi:transketolase [Lichtheimia ornata]|uniref:transketolase n=1 Tax=Lichtheimia ornata TaxID=688661 RepID=A0AAD7Y1I0_9FUNG|nr:transketolase [Lichtheimia ornata]KAJ8661088.1 transketolase [Lichtheimia ornata]